MVLSQAIHSHDYVLFSIVMRLSINKRSQLKMCILIAVLRIHHLPSSFFISPSSCSRYVHVNERLVVSGFLMIVVIGLLYVLQCQVQRWQMYHWMLHLIVYKPPLLFSMLLSSSSSPIDVLNRCGCC
jgi:hypothetical protein